MTCLKVHQLPPYKKKKKPGNESKIIIQKDLEEKTFKTSSSVTLCKS